MASVATRQALPGSTIAEAEALWYDRERWPAFVDGFGALAREQGSWPGAGARVVWDSRPDGRGRVVERVLEHEPRATQLVAVEDASLTGEQRVRFVAAEGGCEIELALRYELKRGGPLGALTNLIFVRRVVGDAQRRTLRRFAVELQADRELTTEAVRPVPPPLNDKES